MDRPKSLVVALIVGLAAAAGAGVAVLAPSLSPANAAAELNLAPPPPASQAVTTPSFADLADRAVTSVVAITSQRIVEGRDPHDMFDNPFFRRFFRGEPFGEGEDQGDRRPRRQQRQWGGSGFFITSDGYILTNKHVVEEAETLFVRTSETAQYEEGIKARLIGTDPYLDLALIKVDGSNTWPALALGDSDRLRVGEWVVAIGNPIIFRNSVTVGVVSGKGRRLDFDGANLDDYIQTDAAINFGNSGGPLLNHRGEVVGINTAIIREDGTNGMMGGAGYVQGIGFALPINPVRRVLSQLAGTGTVKRGYLGVSVQPVDAERAEYLKVPRGRGAYVARVERGTPAYEAGVRQDDVILAVDGKAVTSSEELVGEISAHAPGDTVKLTVWRDGGERKFDVTLAERTVGTRASGEEPEGGVAPEDEEERGETASALGFSVGPLPATLRQRLAEREPPVKGVLITEVEPGSSAASKGLEEGQVLVDLNRQPTPTIEAYRRAGDEVTLFFRAPGKK